MRRGGGAEPPPLLARSCHAADTDRPTSADQLKPVVAGVCWNTAPTLLTTHGPPEPTAIASAPPATSTQSRFSGTSLTISGCSFQTWILCPPAVVLQPMTQVA